MNEVLLPVDNFVESAHTSRAPEELRGDTMRKTKRHKLFRTHVQRLLFRKLIQQLIPPPQPQPGVIQRHPLAGGASLEAYRTVSEVYDSVSQIEQKQRMHRQDFYSLCSLVLPPPQILFARKFLPGGSWEPTSANALNDLLNIGRVRETLQDTPREGTRWCEMPV